MIMEPKHDDNTASPDGNVPLQGKIGVNNNDVGDTDGSGINPEGSNAVQLARAMEKEKIREEMIAESIRRQQLEQEVRMDLLNERRHMGMRNFNGFSNYEFLGVGSHNWPNYDQYLLNLRTSDDIMMNVMSGPTGGTDEFFHVNPYPSQGNEVALGKSLFNRDNPKSNADLPEKVMSEGGSIIGKKRKAEMPCDEDTTPTMSRDSEKLYCSLCGVSTTSEVTMNTHLQGRKHKAKEARFKATDTTPSLQCVSTLKSEQENSSDTKEWDCSLCQVSVTSEALLKSHLQGKKHKAKEAKHQTGVIIDSIQVMSVPSSDGNATDSDNQWYCSLCGVSASSENNLNAHLQGKKHKAKTGSTEKVSKMEVVRDKSLGKEDILKIEKNPDNAISELSKDDPAEAENKQASIPKDILETEGIEVDGDESVELVKYWHCKMCNKETLDEATMAAHRKSDEHMTLLRKHGGGLISVKTIPKVVEAEVMSGEGLSA